MGRKIVFVLKQGYDFSFEKKLNLAVVPYGCYKSERDAYLSSLLGTWDFKVMSITRRDIPTLYRLYSNPVKGDHKNQ